MSGKADAGRQASAIAALALLVPLLTGCERSTRANTGSASTASAGSSAIRFTDVAESAGITFRHESGRSGRFYLPETMGSGCAFLDYNGDGRLDLFLVNSRDLPPLAPPPHRGRGENRLGVPRRLPPSPVGRGGRGG